MSKQKGKTPKPTSIDSSNGFGYLSKLRTLDTFSFPYSKLNAEWKCDKRYGAEAIQRFKLLNQRAFDFLGVQVEVETAGNEPYLKLQTSKYAGSVPLLSPSNGKPFGSMCIGGRFGEDISELLSIVGDTLLPEFNDTLPPLTSSILEPPLYFECCNFIDKWIEVERSRWHKFEVVERTEHIPTSGTRWDVYALKSYDPANVFNYPNRTNKLKQLHPEFRQLLFVLIFCFQELAKPQTPIRSRIAYATKISRLQAKYDESLTLAPPQEFVIHASDPVAVKEAKQIANIILQNKRTNKRAWRIDYSEFFERFVQYVFGEVAKSIMAKTVCNPHYSVSGDRSTWTLRYLEPDLIIQKEDKQFVIDAKYKSHMFNWNDISEELKDTFRHDLHQILAYCSLNTMTTKKALLVYPFTEFGYHEMHLSSPLTRSDADVYLVGLPLKKDQLENVKEKLINELLTFL